MSNRKYRESVWYDQALAYVEYWKRERTKGAGKIAAELRYIVLDFFQQNRYTWVKLIHTSVSGRSYIATGWTFHSPPDIYSAGFGLSEAKKRALRKIAKQLVWERDCSKILKAAGKNLAQVRAEYFALNSKVYQVKSDRIHKRTCDLG